MADENKESKNPLSKFDAQLQAAKTPKELFSMPDVKERYIKNFAAVTGRKDGENRLEQERFAYMEILNNKPELKAAPIWAHFSALLKSATTGLSFRDNKLYVQPIKNRDGEMVGLKVDPSPAGRREMLEMMPTVKKAPQAQVVMKGDIFIYDKLNEKILKHESTDKSVTEDKLENIVASYQRIIWNDGSVSDVVVPQADLFRARAKSKVKNPETDGVWLFVSEASKKTATNRAFRLYHKYPDGVVIYANEDLNDGSGDPEDTDFTNVPDIEVITGEEQKHDDFNPAVNEQTGEVYPTEDAKTKNKPKPKKEPEQFI